MQPDRSLDPPHATAKPAFDRALLALRECSQFDRTVSDAGVSRARLRSKWIAPTRFDRVDLFEAMSRGQARLFVDFPIDARTRQRAGIESHLLPAIRDGFPAD